MKAVVAYILNMQYTNDTAEQFGAVKGANCQFGSTPTEDGHLNIYTWKNDEGETQTSSYEVKDGKDGEKGDPGERGLGIKNVSINSNNHLIITYDNDTTHDAGVIAGGGGGGTIVVANPILSGDEDEMTGIQIDSEKFLVPTTNPSLMTPAQITMLENVLLDCVYVDASGAQKVNALITSLRGGSQKTLSSISATKTKTTYYTDETLSTSDIVVTATYSDSSTTNVTASAILNTSGVDLSVAGTYSIGVSYTENEVTKTTAIQITSVERPAVKTLTGITATKTKTTYAVNDTLSTSDILVTAEYSDSTTAVVTSSAVFDTTGVNMSTAGTYSISVSYTEDGVTETTSIAITVAENQGTVIYTKSSLSMSITNADTKFGTKIDTVSGKKYKYVFDYEVTEGGAIDLRTECPVQEKLINGTKVTGDTGHIAKTVTASYTRNREPFILRYNNTSAGLKLTNITITEYDE